jgi:hypothetical protein
MNATRLLVVVVALQTMILAGQWLGGPSYVSPAQAQIPDAGAQRQQMVDELKTTNAKLDKLISILESGKLQVIAVTPEEKK